MEKCKFCDAQLEEGVMLCPNCGKDNAQEETAVEETAAETVAEEACEAAPAEEAAEETAEEVTEIKEGAKATPGKIALAVIAIVVLVAMIVGMLAGGMGNASGNAAAPTEEVVLEEEPTTPPTIPEDGNPDDVTCKGTYTVTDEEAIAGAGTVVARIGDKELTNAELQVYYWNYVTSYLSSEYGYQAMMYGMLNLSQGLDTQISLADGTLTWQQYFLKCALQNWQSLQAMALEAEAEGFTMDENAKMTLEVIPAQLEEAALQNGFENVDAFVAQNLGAGTTLENFVNYQRTYYQGAPYYNDFVDNLTFTEEQISAFFDENEEAYAQQNLTRDQKKVDVRHCLIMPEGATSATIRTETFSDEAWAASEKKANELLENWLGGDKSEESFVQLVNENTDDNNDTNLDGEPDGGLYAGITLDSNLVEEFKNWCFDETRQPGDAGVVKTQFGYHIMYFVNSELIWPYYVREDMTAMAENAFLMSVLDKHPMEVDFGAINLALVVIQ